MDLFQEVSGFSPSSLPRRVLYLPRQSVCVVSASKRQRQKSFSPDNTSRGVRISINPYPCSKFTALNIRILPRLTICLKFQLAYLTVLHSASMNSSTLRLAWRIIARNVPLSNSLWSGTTIWAKGSSLRKIIWLPSCRLKWKPSFSKALTHSRPEILGSFFILQPQRLRIVLREQGDDLLLMQQYILELPLEYW